MNTIIVLAKALSEAAQEDIKRLDIQYNTKTENYSGRVWLYESIFDIREDGTIEKVKGGCVKNG